MHNNNDCSGQSGPGSLRRGSPSLGEFRFDALSAEEWNYLRGLFLADGYSNLEKVKGGSHSYLVSFLLQGNEKELARMVVGLLGRAGVEAKVVRASSSYELILKCYSAPLLLLLPDKRRLKEDSLSRRRFFEENRLFTVQEGIPFLAGLLDGDGHVGVCFKKRPFRSIVPWDWTFPQARYPFLLGYVLGFVRSLAPSGAALRVERSGVRKVCFLKSGIVALVSAGIGKVSWKVARWQKTVASFRSERELFYDVGQVARMFSVSNKVVRGWLKAGRMKYLRRKGTSINPHGRSWRYIPITEVEAFETCYMTEHGLEEQAKREGVKLVDVARMLGVNRQTLHRMHLRGELRATMVHEGRGGRYFVVPGEEVERLKGKSSRTTKRKRGRTDRGESGTATQSPQNWA